MTMVKRVIIRSNLTAPTRISLFIAETNQDLELTNNPIIIVGLIDQGKAPTEVERDLIGLARDRTEVERDHIGLARDLTGAERDRIGLVRDLIEVERYPIALEKGHIEVGKVLTVRQKGRIEAETDLIGARKVLIVQETANNPFGQVMVPIEAGKVPLGLVRGLTEVEIQNPLPTKMDNHRFGVKCDRTNLMKAHTTVVKTLVAKKGLTGLKIQPVQSKWTDKSLVRLMMTNHIIPTMIPTNKRINRTIVTARDHMIVTTIRMLRPLVATTTKNTNGRQSKPNALPQY